MVGANKAVHDAICVCSEGIMLEPCLLQPCFHVAGSMHKYIYIYIYIYIREREREISPYMTYAIIYIYIYV